MNNTEYYDPSRCLKEASQDEIKESLSEIIKNITKILIKILGQKISTKEGQETWDF